MNSNQNVENAIQRPETRSKKFWRVVLGSMVGFILANMIIGLFSVFFMIAMIAGASTGSAPVVENGSVLKIDLQNPIVERAEDNPFENMDFGSYYSTASTGLDDILNSLKAAADDNRIKGIYLNLKSVSANPATLTAIRDALKAFKESDKFIYAYSETYSQSAYYLASAADKVFLNTKGGLDFRGVAFQVMFYKNLLNKLGVDVQVVRHGKFKSAVEPYILDKMSPANREQMEVMAHSLWHSFAQEISVDRRISEDSLNVMADNLLISTAEDALRYHLVDGLVYRNQFEDIMKQKLQLEKDEDIKFISLNQYKKTITEPRKRSANKIAVIYAVGQIVDGKGGSSIIGSTSLCKEIREAYKNEKVKAIVLRVNSPGGSALASEVIWNEIEQAKAAGKIVVTSMGDYAASGGYYISCNSDMILAQPNTLTGSIGVFGIIPNVQKMMKDKLGVNVDIAQSNKHATGIGVFKPMDETEYKFMLTQIEDIYATFTQRVSDGRNMPVERVDEIGQGRVWSGVDALELGLVDKLGSLDDAVVAAAELAKISEYDVDYYPLKKSWLDKILNSMNDEDAVAKMMRSELGDLYYTYEAFKNVMTMEGIQARMPMEIKIEE
jgi:protease-4